MIEQLFPGGKGGGGTVDTIQAGTGISVDATNPASPIVSSTVVDTNDAAKVSSNDTTAGYLNGKLVAGSNITLTENNNGGNETLTIAAAGGVTGFTGSQNTASPNNTVNASRLLVDATSTNADAVLQPKGTGALLAQLPNGAVSGGNKRGANAVDLQTSRDNAAKIASGEFSFAAGISNTASGYASVAIGESNSATGSDSLALGVSAIASGTRSICLGTSLNSTTASAQESICIGSAGTASGNNSLSIGLLNTASGVRATVVGGAYAVANRYGMRAYSSARFDTDPAGGLQEEKYILLIKTTNDTQTEMTADGGAGASTNRISIASDATYTFSALVTARRTDADNESAGYKIEGVIDNNAGTTAFVGTPTVTILGEDTAAWDVVVEADNTNDALVFKVTGEANKTIRWGAVVELMKVAG